MQRPCKQADYLIHLAGEGIADKRWSKKRKKEIVDSRVESSAFIVKILKDFPNRIQTVVSASAIGWYGADAKKNPQPFIETDAPETDFLGEACRLWEESIEPVTEMGKRLVKLRTGIVLTKEGGALKEFVMPIRFGVAAILGTGKQVISWIHIDDLCRMYLMALENESIKGVYNAVAPKPVTNRELTLKLAERIKKRFFVPLYIPSFLLKLVIGELSVEVLKSTTVSCERIRMSGFSFIYPSIESAIGALYKDKSD